MAIVAPQFSTLAFAAALGALWATVIVSVLTDTPLLVVWLMVVLASVAVPFIFGMGLLLALAIDAIVTSLRAPRRYING